MISVCLASFNGEKYIKEQIDSILFQLDDNDELIISDDGSSDKTISIIHEYNDKRITLLHNKEHGVNHNFENAIKHAKGEYIFWSDQDDVWMPNKVKICIEKLKCFDLIVHDCIVADKYLNVIYPSYFEEFNSGPGYFKNIIKNSYIGACLAFKKEILSYSLPIPKGWPVYIDGWFGSLVDLHGKICFINEPLIYYRRHDSNQSPSGGKSSYSIWQRIKQRLGWIWYTLSRSFIIYIKC